MRVFLLLPLFAVLAGAIPSAAAERIPAPHVETNEKMAAIQEKLDIRYFEGTGRQKLDVFSPTGCPGSARGDLCPRRRLDGWRQEPLRPLSQHRPVFRRQGIVAVMVNYRLSPLVKHPEHVRDVARAFAWTRKHRP